MSIFLDIVGVILVLLGTASLTVAFAFAIDRRVETTPSNVFMACLWLALGLISILVGAEAISQARLWVELAKEVGR